MQVFCNDKPYEMPEGSKIKNLLELQNLDDNKNIAVAVDYKIISRDMWDKHELNDGDNVIIITPVQGG